MAAATTVDRHHHLHFDSLPLIDLRLLTQSEILSLTFCSARRASATSASQNDDEDEISTPKVDRSVFNESAGSRKQTFSRLRLAPRNSSQFSPQIPYVASRGETLTLDEDNSQIVGLLESLFNIQALSSNTIENNQQLVPVQVEYKAFLNDVNVDEGLYDVPIKLDTCCATKRKRGRPRKDESVPSGSWWLMDTVNKVNVLGESAVKIRDNVDVVCETGERKPGRPTKNENKDKIEGVLAIESSTNVGKKGPGRPRKEDLIPSDNWRLIETEKKVNVLSENSVETRDNADVVVCETGKRKQGRPKKNENNKIEVVLASESSTNADRKEPGWPRKDELIPSGNQCLMEIEKKVNVLSESSVKIRDNADVVVCETGKRKRGRPRKNENKDNVKVVSAVEGSANDGKKGPGRPRKGESKNGDKYVKKEIVVSKNEWDLVNEAVMENRNGVAVNLVALASMEDPFGEELRRRTEGNEKREELLAFMTGLKGVWVNFAKRRKIVEASEFGDVLPKDWKLMLCIKKKVGNVWLGCHRYISPNGRQFVSCKEVSSYLLSLAGVKDAMKPNAAHTGDCVQLNNQMTFGNAINLTPKDDKNGVGLLFNSQFPTTSRCTGREKEATLRKIMSPEEMERHENCNKKHSVPEITTERLEETDASTEVTAANLGVSLGAERVLCNNQNNKNFGSSGGRGVAKKTVSSCNNMSRQEGIPLPCFLDNSENGVNLSSMQKQNQEMSFESGFVSPNNEDKTSSCQNLDKRLSIGTMGQMKVHVGEDVRDETIAGSGNGCSWFDDTVPYNKDQESFDGCSIVASGSELKCGSVNKRNRLSTSSLSPALLERSSGSGLHFSSGNVRTCDFNNGLTRVSNSILRNPKYGGVYKSENNELAFGFGNTHSVNNQGMPEDLNLFGSEKNFGSDDDLTKAYTEMMEISKLDEVRKSDGHAHGQNNNYRVDASTKESRSEDSHSARNSELMTDLSNHNQSSAEFMNEFLWRTDEENILSRGLTDTSSRRLQTSGCLPAVGQMSDKGVSELFSEKYDRISGFGELRPGNAQHVEFNFRTTRPSSDSDAPKVLPYDAGMSQGYDTWLEKDALPLSPNLGSMHQVATVCAWCGNEFLQEPIDTAGETGSVCFMCPTCKAKF